MAGLPLDRVREKLQELQALVDGFDDTGCTSLDDSQCTEIAKAARQLTVLANPPLKAGFEITMMPYVATAVRLALDLGIFKSLAIHSPQTAESLAKNALTHTKAPNVDVDFVVRIMRLVTLYGLVTESAPRTYAANATTIAFGEPGSGLQSLQEHFYDFYTPVLEHSVSYFATHGYTLPMDSHVGPFQSFYQTDKATYDYWLDQPPYILARLNNFMKVLHSRPWYEWMDAPRRIQRRLAETPPPEALSCSCSDDNATAHPLPNERLLVVDIGGGKGDDLRRLRHRLDEIGVRGTLMLQDRASVIREILHLPAPGASSPETSQSSASPSDAPLRNGVPGITYLAHDFFAPQPAHAKGSMYYFLRHIIHNWPDARCVEILKGVAAAMTPGYSRLLINERVIRPTGNDLHAAGLDFHMAFSHASKERTLEEFRVLVEAAGLEIVEFHRSPDEGEDVVECALN